MPRPCPGPDRWTPPLRGSARPRACAANCACPATSRSATAPCCWPRWPTARAGSAAPVTAPTSARRPGSSRALGATVERMREDGRTVDYRVVSPGADGLPRAGGHARLRQLRHEPAADERGARRAALDGDPRRRRFVASPSGGSYHRTAALDGGVAPCPSERFPPSPDRDRSYPAHGHRLHDAGAERTGEVGGPAGGTSGGWSDDGPGVDRNARPHGTDASSAWRAESSAAADRMAR